MTFALISPTPSGTTTPCVAWRGCWNTARCRVRGAWPAWWTGGCLVVRGCRAPVPWFVVPPSVSCTPTAGASPRSALVYSCIYLLVCLFIYLLCFAVISLMYTNGWSLSKVRFSVQLYLFTCLFVCLLCFAVISLMYANGWSLSKVRFSVQLYLFTCLFIYLFVCLLVCLFIYLLCYAVISLMYTNGWSLSKVSFSIQLYLFTCLFVYLFIVFRCDQSHVHQWLEPLQGQI